MAKVNACRSDTHRRGALGAVPMRLGAVLHKWRLMQDMSVRDAAKEIGLSPATFSRLENGREIDARTLMKIFNWLTSGNGQR